METISHPEERKIHGGLVLHLQPVQPNLTSTLFAVQKPRDVEMEKVGKGGGTLCKEKLRPPASTTRSLGTSAVSTLHNAEYSRPMITHIYQYQIT